MAIIKINPSTLKGTIQSQPSKSYTHRALLCAALASGKSTVDNVVLSQDIKATINAIESIGAKVEINESSKYKNRTLLNVVGCSGNITFKSDFINCSESGSTARFIIPITRLTEKSVTVTGENGLLERPFNVYFKIFEDNNIEYISKKNCLPLTMSGSIKSGSYEIDGQISSQFITGMFYALPLLEGDSKIIIKGNLESKPYIDMTISILKEYGIKIEENNNTFYIKGNQKYIAKNYVVEGDWSQAAFWLVAGCIGNDLTIDGLKLNSLQGDKKIIDVIKLMNGKIENSGNGIRCYSKDTKGIIYDTADTPDIVPILTVLAAKSQGVTNIINASRLRIKESDRLHSVACEFNKLGINIIEEKDSLKIYGGNKISGGLVSGCNDHRIVMSLAILSTISKKEVIIEGFEAVNKSYPEFFNDFKMLGGKWGII